VEPGPWDLVLCRNVTIYLEPTASERLLRAIAGQLGPGAFVVSGKAERLPASIPTQTAARCVHRVWR
jgi:chemotaxis protein methyltransferase CheR